MSKTIFRDQAVAVGVQAAGGHADHHVAGRDGPAVDHAASVSTTPTQKPARS